MEKVLFVEINSLDNERGCFASNAYFAKFFGVSDRQIRTVISSLRTKGFVSVSIRNRNDRVIRTIGKYRRVGSAELQTLKQSHADLISKMRIRGSKGVGRKLPGR
jgi:hypothetical protein